MTVTRSPDHRRQLPGPVPIAALLITLVMSGCAQMDKLKSRVGGQSTHQSTEVSRADAARAAHAGGDVSFAAIVNNQLQHGDYAEGEKALRRYLAQHPGDRPAQAMLRQLTTNPEQWLGRKSQPHVVQAGDSYSTLAARYLDDASLFLILARYNGSTNPSLLRVGDTVQVPTAAARSSMPTVTVSPNATGPDRTASAETTIGISPTIGQDVPTTRESPATKAKRLQRESVALLDGGHKEQALSRLDEALAVDPQLAPDGNKAVSLRKDLAASLHQRAIVLYRDQRLDPAIALWDRVLAIDPHYEPAVVYRTRALELKRRLKQL